MSWHTHVRTYVHVHAHIIMYLFLLSPSESLHSSAYSSHCTDGRPFVLRLHSSTLSTSDGWPFVLRLHSSTLSTSDRWLLVLRLQSSSLSTSDGWLFVLRLHSSSLMTSDWTDNGGPSLLRLQDAVLLLWRDLGSSLEMDDTSSDNTTSAS